MEVDIREAAERDYQSLCLIIGEVDGMHRDALPEWFRAPDGPSRQRGYIRDLIRAPDVGLFVAETAGDLVGFVHVVLRDTPDISILVPRRYAVIDNLVVKHGSRQQGIGRALMGRAEAWARARGASSMELTVYAFNQAAQRFYRELGYTVLSHKMTKPLEAGQSETE